MPSNQQNNGLASGRKPREIKPTKKIRESQEMGENPPAFSSSPFATPNSGSRQVSRASQTSPLFPSPSTPRISSASVNYSTPPQVQPAAEEVRPVASPTPAATSTTASGSFVTAEPSPTPKASAARETTQQDTAEMPKARTKATTKKAPARRPKAKPASTRAPRRAPKYITDVEPSSQGLAPDDTVIPQLDSRNFTIYRWPYPPPRNFEKLSEQHQKFKTEADEASNQLDSVDLGDSAEDWADFAGDLDLYDSDADRARAIASNFVHRAKQAFRENRTWAEFESDERTADSMTAARRERDLTKRAVLLRMSLRNDVRLAVFDAIRLRLRAEIWLEYEEVHEAADADPAQRQDSVAPTSAPRLMQAPQMNETRSQTGVPAAEEQAVRRWQTGLGGRRLIPVWNDAHNGQEEDTEDDVDLNEYRRSWGFR